MPFDYYIKSGYNKNLRCGFTTGTCAAIAAKAAVILLLSGNSVEYCSVITPKGIEVETQIVDSRIDNGVALCSVIKDGGDDIDATDGIEITASVEKVRSGILIDGGEGIGRVTKSGLDQPVGCAAINSVPRSMIEEAVKGVCAELGYKGGIKVIISAPEGMKIAGKTFNPNIGIDGGISIIGTSGIVEPKSLKAIADTVRIELRVLKNSGSKNVIITPGNYGESYLKNSSIFNNVPYVKCSNFIGDALEEAASLDFKKILVVGHMGKLIKLASGMFNTHSYYGDCRMEIFSAHAALCGVSKETVARIMECVTVDSALSVIEADKALFKAVNNSIMSKIQFNLNRKLPDNIDVGAVAFTNIYGTLAISAEGKKILSCFGGQYE